MAVSRDRDVEEVDTTDVDAEESALPKVVYPFNDGEGGTKYVFGGDEDGPEATYEDWAAQNGIALPPEEEVIDAEDDGA